MAEMSDPLGSSLADTWGLDLAGLVHDAVVAMAFVDTAGRYAMVNPAFCELAGRSELDLLGRRPEDLLKPDDHDSWAARRDALMQSAASRVGGIGGPASNQAHEHYIRPEGTEVVGYSTTTVMRDQAGCPVGLFIQILDITDAVATRESLSRSESLLQALMANASELMVLVDQNGRITYATGAALPLLGYEPAALLARSAFSFIHPDDRSRATLQFTAHLEGEGQREPGEYRITRRDGSFANANAIVTNLLGDPRVGAMVVNLRDVTEQKFHQDQLLDRERRFRALVANSWDIITVHDATGRYLYCSPAITVQLGYHPDELVGSNPFSFIHPDDMDAAVDFRQVVERNANGTTVQYRFPHKNGEWRWVESAMHNRLDDLAVGGVVVTTRDVTQRRRHDAQQAAVAAIGSRTLIGGDPGQLMQFAVDKVAEALDAEYCAAVRDEGDGTMRVLARFGEQLFPEVYPAEEGGRLSTVSVKALRQQSTVVWNRTGPLPGTGGLLEALRSGAAAVISPASGRKGALSVYSRRPGAFSNDDIAFLESAAHVLAAAVSRHRMEEELRRQALHDELTGLPNRVLLIDRLRHALDRLDRRGASLAVLFIDVDNFKLVNDSLGHPAGDVVVAAVADRIQRAVRTSDTVSRFGGDELVVISEDTGEEEAADLVERLRDALASPEDPIEVEGRRVTVTASIGYVVTADGSLTADDVLARADAAMYAAKQAGKDRGMAFSSHMRDTASAQLDAVQGIRRGLENDEFLLHYQPIIDVTNTTIVGREALARWQHPLEGLVGPGSFIGFAEESGLIIPLGEWVLRTACAQSARWLQAGEPAYVSVNISPRQLLESDLVTTVRRALDDTGIPPKFLSLELTEYAVMTDLPRATRLIEELGALGVSVGMDDFGTGQSSLSQLARLPLDFVKIDQAFVRHVDTDRRSAALLESVVTLTRALDLHSIAEGVERVEQLEYLKQVGVTLVQGFLFSPPVPA